MFSFLHLMSNCFLNRDHFVEMKKRVLSTKVHPYVMLVSKNAISPVRHMHLAEADLPQ